MNEYKKFSYYYDEVMTTLDYEEWFEFIKPYVTPNTKLLNNVYNALENNGYFIFDIFSKYLMEEYEDNGFINDYDTFKIDWQTKKINSTTLEHNVKIFEDDKTYEEKYYEYFYDFKDFDFSKFKVIKICGDFNDDLVGDDERIIFVLQKR